MARRRDNSLFAAGLPVLSVCPSTLKRNPGYDATTPPKRASASRAVLLRVAAPVAKFTPAISETRPRSVWASLAERH